MSTHSIESIPPASGFPKRLLLVDDDVATLGTLAETLSKRGYSVETAKSGVEALRTFRRNFYSVVLVDFSMPGMTGLEFVREARQVCSATAFVLLKGARDGDLPVNEDADAGIVSIIAKPWQPAELNDVLDNAQRVAEARHARRSNLDAPTIRVLLIEDDDIDARQVQRALRRGSMAFEVVETTSLAAAMEALHESSFDVVLTDLSLPDGRGLDAVVRLHRVAPHAAIIVLSGLDDPDVALLTVQSGAQDYVHKSTFDASSLMHTVRYALERKRNERELLRLAHTDQLTGLANRAMFHERLTHALARAQRDASTFGILFIDLDHFKQVNDTLGHDVGDMLLQTVADRLRSSVREHDTVARLRGDEFAVLVDTGAPKDAIHGVARRIVNAMAEPIRLNEKQLTVTSSVGLAVYPEAGLSTEVLLRSADLAMYDAKHNGKNRYETAASIETPPT